MNNVIQQLKDNEKPFGRMSKEMQEKAKEIGFHGNFRLYSGYGDFDGFGAIIDNPEYGYQLNYTYRLRPDYEDEPEIVECEITGIDCHLHFRYDGMSHSIHQACDHADFIGFKFLDGMWYGSPIMPVNSSGKQISWANITLDNILSGKVKILDATAVLFRGKKKE